MQDSDKVKFAGMMTGIAEMYDKSMSKEKLRVYWLALQGYDIEDVGRSLNLHAVNPDVGRFMPLPADIVKSIDGDGQSNAMRAWSAVDRAFRTIGPYQSVIFDDAKIHAVLQDMGGWGSFANIEEKDWMFRGKEFQKRYQGLSGRDFEYPKKLLGIADVHNSAEGHKTANPKLIGNPQAAKLVYQKGSEQSSVKALEVDEKSLSSIVGKLEVLK